MGSPHVTRVHFRNQGHPSEHEWPGKPVCSWAGNVPIVSNILYEGAHFLGTVSLIYT